MVGLVIFWVAYHGQKLRLHILVDFVIEVLFHGWFFFRKGVCDLFCGQFCDFLGGLSWVQGSTSTPL
jgi:hypothetical protein